MDLVPTLELNLALAGKRRLREVQAAENPFRVSEPAHVYISLVRDKYNEADNRLIERLGEANWQRHVNIRRRMDAMMNNIEHELDPLTEKDLMPSFLGPSVFHDSGLGTSSAVSHSSFVSSNASSDLTAARVPQMPAEVGLGDPFQCIYCGYTIHNIKNRQDWKYVSTGAQRRALQAEFLQDACIRGPSTVYLHIFRVSGRASAIQKPQPMGRSWIQWTSRRKDLGLSAMLYRIPAPRKLGTACAEFTRYCVLRSKASNCYCDSIQTKRKARRAWEVLSLQQNYREITQGLYKACGTTYGGDCTNGTATRDRRWFRGSFGNHKWRLWSSFRSEWR